MGDFGSIIGPVASIWSSNKAAKAQQNAAQEAAQAQVEATKLSIASQEAMQAKALAAQEKALAEQRGYLQPYGDAGTQALYQYLYRIGAGAPSAVAYKAAFQNPSTTSRIAELQSKIAGLQPAAATGTTGTAATATTGTAGTDADYAAQLLTRQGLMTNQAISEAARAVQAGTASDFQKQVVADAAKAFRLKPSAAAATPATAATPALTAEQQTELAGYQSELANLQAQQAASDVGEFSPWNLEESPTYRLQMEDTQRAIDKALRARGLYGSGYGVSSQADNARRLAAAEQAAQLTRLQGLTSMGQEARTGMASGGLAAASQMANLYGQGAQLATQTYQNQGTALGNAALMSGAAQAANYGSIGNAIANAFGNYSQNRSANTTATPTATQTTVPSYKLTIPTMESYYALNAQPLSTVRI